MSSENKRLMGDYIVIFEALERRHGDRVAHKVIRASEGYTSKPFDEQGRPWKRYVSEDVFLRELKKAKQKAKEG